MPKLNEGDQIVAVWAESCSGPGWANQPVWVLVRALSGFLRIECLQPSEQSSVLLTCHRFAAELHTVMMREARALMTRKEKDL